jgi:hypothetical protein
MVAPRKFPHQNYGRDSSASAAIREQRSDVSMLAVESDDLRLSEPTLGPLSLPPRSERRPA